MAMICVAIAATTVVAVPVFSCSMYKVTAYGKTMVGNNEDSWRLTSQIWFEPGTNGQYGVAYVGYSDKPMAEGAFNECGLVYDGFSVPLYRPKVNATKKQLNERFDMRFVMQTCKDVNDVRERLGGYDLSVLDGGMLLFVDRFGNYLVVESDTMISGNDQTYVLSNFCPSRVTDLSTVKQQRYRNGVAFLKNKLDTALPFCVALSDTMHVCRDKIGDGTLYTCIYDLADGIIHLYFYHDYKHDVTFRLKDELAKGTHRYDIASLFPRNEEYERLRAYKTPQNSRALFGLTLFSGVAFLCSAGTFTMRTFRKRKTKLETKVVLLDPLVVLFNVTMTAFLFVLMFHQGIFYFPMPYTEPGAPMVSVLSYTPLAALLMIAPLVIANVYMWKHAPQAFATRIFSFVNVIAIGWLCMFVYWGFFEQLFF